MWIDEDLPKSIADAIQPLCDKGEELGKQGQSREAIEKFSEAFKLLPKPPHQWLAATWILTAIGDTAFLAGDMRTAGAAFGEVGLCEGWHDNPFIRLRRGQVAFEAGDLRQASNELASAFIIERYGIFEREDQKYAEFILAQLDPPVPPVDHPLARFHRKPQGAQDEAGDAHGNAKPWWRFW